MSILNSPIVLTIPHLIPAILKTTYATYLRLRRICDDDETFEKRSPEYQNYLIPTDHKSSIVRKQSSQVKKKTRSEARQKQTKRDKVSDTKFISAYNPALPNIHSIIQNNLSIAHC